MFRVECFFFFRIISEIISIILQFLCLFKIQHIVLKKKNTASVSSQVFCRGVLRPCQTLSHLLTFKLQASVLEMPEGTDGHTECVTYCIPLFRT